VPATAAFALFLAVTTTPAAGPAVYVALGDSTGVGMGAGNRGYPARLAARSMRPVRLVNLCVSGARAEDLVRDQLEPALAARPAVATLAIGINDVIGETPPERFEAAVERAVSAVAAAGARLVIVTIPDLSLSPRVEGGAARAGVLGRTRELNERLAAVARRHGVPLADLFGPGAEVYGGDGTLSGDRFHPSAKGYERWVEAIAPAFDGAVQASGGAGGPGLSPDPALR
jgi:acyl-CoA thioesterase I